MYLFIVLRIEKRLKVFLDTLLDLNDAGANFTNDEIRDEVVTMMIGVSIYFETRESKNRLQNCKINFQGSETSGITVCFCLLMLAIHQDIQVRLILS